MSLPGRLDLAGGRRVPFSCLIALVGIDLTGASVLAQVRLTPDAAGDPLATLCTGAPTSSASITLHLAAADMTALPAAAEIGDTVVLAWDLIVTPAAGDPYVLLSGSFTVLPGVSHA